MKPLGPAIVIVSTLLVFLAASAVPSRSWAHAQASAVEWLHPHVWVVVHSRIVYSPNGKIAGIVHDWTFDEKYSSFVMHSRAKDGALATREELAPLAKENAVALARSHYYTTLKIGGRTADFGRAANYWMELGADHRVTLHMVLPLKTPVTDGRPILLSVADPEQLIDFRFEDEEAIQLAAAPPCSKAASESKSPEQGVSNKLSESYFSSLAPDRVSAVRVAGRAIISCP